MSRYHYTECGLPNVWIENLEVHVDDAGEEAYRIPNIVGLHRVIARGIIDAKVGMTGPELRFLRSEMGMTQAELAQLVHKDGQTVGRWERGENPIDENAQTIIRLMAIEALELEDRDVRTLASASIQTAVAPEIRIDGADPADYRVAA